MEKLISIIQISFISSLFTITQPYLFVFLLCLENIQTIFALFWQSIMPNMWVPYINKLHVKLAWRPKFFKAIYKKKKKICQWLIACREQELWQTIIKVRNFSSYLYERNFIIHTHIYLYSKKYLKKPKTHTTKNIKISKIFFH